MYPNGGRTRTKEHHDSSNWPITSPRSFTGSAEPIFNWGGGGGGLKPSSPVKCEIYGLGYAIFNILHDIFSVQKFRTVFVEGCGLANFRHKIKQNTFMYFTSFSKKLVSMNRIK